MLDSASTARVVLTTASNDAEAQRIAHILVEEKLAACVTLLPFAQSIYRWQGEIASASEILLLMKTSQERLAALQSRLSDLHSYDTPEFLVLSIDLGSHSYLEWLQASLR